MQPRDYQQAAHDAVIASWRRSIAPVVVSAPTGAGKSVIVAMLAHTLRSLAPKRRVVCLAPSGELVQQNAAKYTALGEPCSIYSASVSKSLRHPVIHATEGTFKAVARRMGPDISGIIIDEAHRVTPTIRKIVDDIRLGNPNVRVCGLSATPYRLGQGYIYGMDVNGVRVLSDDPYYDRCVYDIEPRLLVDRGYLSTLVPGRTYAEEYDTSGLVMDSKRQFTSESVARTFVGRGRATADIVADVVRASAGRRGVMFFAASVDHAHEIAESLPPEQTAVVTGGMTKAERAGAIEAFKAQKLRYIVNVSVLTTGFDAPHVDVIALLRATESAGLLQQILGRGMRPYVNKSDCLVLDYAQNLIKHFPSGDLYTPEVKLARSDTCESVVVRCPKCNRQSEQSVRPNENGYEMDEAGYYLDLSGEVVVGEHGPIPGHFGRRCPHVDNAGNRCDYYWTSKECPECEHRNDIAARRCKQCGAELVDPNDKLDKTITEAAYSIDSAFVVSRAGHDMVTVRVSTESRLLTLYYTKASSFAVSKYYEAARATKNFTETGSKITYVKDGNFWRVLNWRAA